MPFRKFPLWFNRDILQATVFRKTASDKSPEECWGRIAQEVEIRLHSEKKGQKVIASYDTCASNSPIIEAIEGFMKSPFEDRIVVLVSGTQYNSENRWDAKFIPIGAHLTQGF